MRRGAEQRGRRSVEELNKDNKKQCSSSSSSRRQKHDSEHLAAEEPEHKKKARVLKPAGTLRLARRRAMRREALRAITWIAQRRGATAIWRCIEDTPAEDWAQMLFQETSRRGLDAPAVRLGARPRDVLDRGGPRWPHGTWDTTIAVTGSVMNT